MASDNARFLINKFLTCFTEAESTLPLGLKPEFLHFKVFLDAEENKQKIIFSSSSSKALSLLYDLNDALEETRIFVSQSKELKRKVFRFNFVSEFHFIRRMNDWLRTLKGELIVANTNSSPLVPTFFATGRPTSWRVDASKLIGFDDYTEKIEVALSGNGFKAIGIYGMGGTGKTALVQKVLNSRTVLQSFSPIIWLCLSEISSEEEDIDGKILKYMLEELGCDIDGLIVKYRNDELLKILYCKLKGRKYLIVLDDVWHVNDWFGDLVDHTLSVAGSISNRLSQALPKDSGGAVIVTSRLKKVAQQIVGEKNLLHLKPMNEEICRSILETTIGVGEYITQIDNLLSDNRFKAIGVHGTNDSGKTALIKEILSNPKTCGKFRPIIRVCLTDISFSEEEDLEGNIMKYILEELGYDIDGLIGNLTNVELLRILNHFLTSRKYLILLDDAWQQNDWYGDLGCTLAEADRIGVRLSHALPKDSGGAVVVTSRLKEVARAMAGEKNLIHLKPWSILESIRKESAVTSGDHDLDNIMDEIVHHCQGLPLAAKALATIIPEKTLKT